VACRRRPRGEAKEESGESEVDSKILESSSPVRLDFVIKKAVSVPKAA
jgi:hypothetical protein